MICNNMRADLVRTVLAKVASVKYEIAGQVFARSITSTASDEAQGYIKYSVRILANDRPNEVCTKVMLCNSDGVPLFERNVQINRVQEFGDTLYIYEIDINGVEL